MVSSYRIGARHILEYSIVQKGGSDVTLAGEALQKIKEYAHNNTAEEERRVQGRLNTILDVWFQSEDFECLAEAVCLMLIKLMEEGILK